MAGLCGRVWVGMGGYGRVRARPTGGIKGGQSLLPQPMTPGGPGVGGFASYLDALMLQANLVSCLVDFARF